MEHVNDGVCDALYRAAVENTEEAVINSMLAAESAPEFRPGGAVCEALDAAQLMRIMAMYGRPGSVAS